MNSEWAEQARCRNDVDPEVFFPEDGQPFEPAREFCGSCPVSLDCLTEALYVKDGFGIRGGFGPKRRSAAIMAAYRPSRPGRTRITLTLRQAREVAEEMVARDGARIRRRRAVTAA